MAQSSRTPTSRRQQDKLKRKLMRGVLIFGSIIILLWGSLIGISYAQWGRINTVMIADNPHIDQDQSQNDVWEIINKHWPIMGNHDRHWSLPRKKIKEKMFMQSNTIRSVALDYRDNSLYIDMEVFEPYYITCFRDDACGFTSRDGYVYDQAPDFSPGVYAVLEVDFESPQYSEGPLYLDQNQRDAVDAILLADAGELWGKPDKIVMDIFDISIFFDEINNTALPEAAYIVINQKYLSDYEQYLSRRLRALKSKTDFFDRLNSQTSQFKYLDLRFEDKIYMKFAE